MKSGELQFRAHVFRLLSENNEEPSNPLVQHEASKRTKNIDASCSEAVVIVELLCLSKWRE